MANRQMVMSAGEVNRTHAGVAMAMAAVTGIKKDPDLLRKEAARHLKDRVRPPIKAVHPLHRTGTRKDKC